MQFRFSSASCMSLVALKVLFLTPAHAATSVPFQSYRNSTCASGPDCTINFPLVATGKRLEISNVSCYTRFEGFSSDVDVVAQQLLVIDPPSTVVGAVTLKTQAIDSTAGYTAYASNDQIFAFANPGTRFQAFLRFSRGKIQQFACHISGSMITP